MCPVWATSKFGYQNKEPPPVTTQLDLSYRVVSEACFGVSAGPTGGMGYTSPQPSDTPLAAWLEAAGVGLSEQGQVLSEQGEVLSEQGLSEQGQVLLTVGRL